MEFYVIGDQEGKVRICVDQGEDTPPFMPGSAAAFAIGGDLWKATKAAIVASCPDSDDRGLFWRSLASAEVAAEAAKGALS